MFKCGDSLAHSLETWAQNCTEQFSWPSLTSGFPIILAIETIQVDIIAIILFIVFKSLTQILILHQKYRLSER